VFRLVRPAEFPGLPLTINRAAILASLANGESIQDVAVENDLHPFLVEHIKRRFQKTETIHVPEARIPVSRKASGVKNERRRLDANALRAAIAAGKSVKQIAGEHPGVFIASIYKALKRWQISFTPANQNAKERVSCGD
jgi:transposase